MGFAIVLYLCEYVTEYFLWGQGDVCFCCISIITDHFLKCSVSSRITYHDLFFSF